MQRNITRIASPPPPRKVRYIHRSLSPNVLHGFTYIRSSHHDASCFSETGFYCSLNAGPYKRIKDDVSIGLFYNHHIQDN